MAARKAFGDKLNGMSVRHLMADHRRAGRVQQRDASSLLAHRLPRLSGGTSANALAVRFQKD